MDSDHADDCRLKVSPQMGIVALLSFGLRTIHLTLWMSILVGVRLIGLVTIRYFRI